MLWNMDCPLLTLLTQFACLGTGFLLLICHILIYYIRVMVAKENLTGIDGGFDCGGAMGHKCSKIYLSFLLAHKAPD